MTRSLPILSAVVLAALCPIGQAADVSTPLAGKPGVVAKTSVSVDVSDLWFNSAESGWGMQLVQEGTFTFATLFVYGTGSQPTWATAQLSYVGGGVYTGPLYLTTGPYYGGAFDPSQVVIRQAGTMTFATSSIQAGTVTYSVDGVQVVKQVERQTLVNEDYSGGYIATLNMMLTACTDPSRDGSGTSPLAMSITQTGTSMAMTWNFVDGSVCNYAGAYSQSGHIGEFTGSYTCSTGEAGAMHLFELTNRVGMVNGRIAGGSTNMGCQFTGRFTGLDPSAP